MLTRRHYSLSAFQHYPTPIRLLPFTLCQDLGFLGEVNRAFIRVGLQPLTNGWHHDHSLSGRLHSHQVDEWPLVAACTQISINRLLITVDCECCRTINLVKQNWMICSRASGLGCEVSSYKIMSFAESQSQLSSPLYCRQPSQNEFGTQEYIVCWQAAGPDLQLG